jgi:hypothetical protein
VKYLLIRVVLIKGKIKNARRLFERISKPVNPRGPTIIGLFGTNLDRRLQDEGLSALLQGHLQGLVQS